MSATIINIILQLIAGIIGGNAAGSGMKNISLGTAGNTIAGALGGLGGGQLLELIIPALQGATGGGAATAPVHSVRISRPSAGWRGNARGSWRVIITTSSSRSRMTSTRSGWPTSR